jgi:polyhydroxyalkanoate synthase
MDLIPKPDQIVAAASNVAHKVLYGGLADLRPMPRTLIDDGVLREVYHYRPRGHVREHGDPVLLVTPLAAPALCFDLRRGCSLVEHFVSAGRPTYLTGSTRSSRPRSRRRAGTPAAARSTSSAGASAGSSRC